MQAISYSGNYFVQTGSTQLKPFVSLPVFSNGGIDHWNHWGILKNINPSIEAVFIAEGEHCGDIKYVDGVYTEAQNIERKHIEKWINEANSRNNNAL